MKIGINQSNIARIFLILLIIATLVFIFSNSLKNQEESSADSAAVGSIIAAIFPPDTPLGAFARENLRSIAHFAEFALLGAECAFYVAFFTKKRLRNALLSPFIGLAVGFIDESLQYLSDRAPEIADVWLDLGGFVSFSVLTYIVLTVAAYVKYRVDENKQRRVEHG